MKTKKIHFTDKPNCPAKNNKNILTTDDYRDVTCDHCKKDETYLQVLHEAEEKRPLLPHEFDEPFEVIKYDGIGCDYCLLKDTNKTCKDNTYPCTKKNGSKYFKQIHKTQTSLNKSIENDCESVEEPFNNQKWRTLDNGDIEIVNVSRDDIFKINKYIKKERSAIYRTSATKNITLWFKRKSDENKFKEFMKTLEEKEELSKGIEEPFNDYFTEENYRKAFGVKEEKKDSRKSNHSEHYKPESEPLECIEKMELIICHGLPKEYHELVIENLNFALGAKYIDRLGKKDDTEKEISKMKNYNHRSVKGVWR